MLNYDFSPFYRSTVGFDRLLTLLDKASGAENAQTYPPYNIERTGENPYRITVAVAGFAESELTVETKEGVLTIRGAKETLRRGRREARDALSGHRGARFRAPLPARRPVSAAKRDRRERPAACRAGARGARGAEAPHDRDPDGLAKTIERRQAGRVRSSF